MVAKLSIKLDSWNLHVAVKKFMHAISMYTFRLQEDIFCVKYMWSYMKYMIV